VSRHTVNLWRKRFSAEGLDGLWDIAPGRGRKPVYEIDKIAAIVDANSAKTKPAGMTHWSCRTMAQSQGIGKSTVSNIWRAHKLQHIAQDIQAVARSKVLEKMTDVVGLYLNPPQEAVVLCSMKRARSRLWIAPSPDCQSRRAVAAQ